MAKAKTQQIQKMVKIDPRFLEVLGCLAIDSERKFSDEYFEKRGLASAFNTLKELGMVSREKGRQTPYSLNERGREYVNRVLDISCDISNRGQTNVRYSRASPLGAILIEVDEFPPSPVKISYRE